MFCFSSIISVLNRKSEWQQNIADCHSIFFLSFSNDIPTFFFFYFNWKNFSFFARFMLCYVWYLTCQHVIFIFFLFLLLAIWRSNAHTQRVNTLYNWAQAFDRKRAPPSKCIHFSFHISIQFLYFSYIYTWCN